MADARTAAASAGVKDPAGLLVLRSDGTRQRVEAVSIGSNLPDSVAGAVARRTVGRLATWPGRGRVFMYLRLDSLPTPETPVGGVRVECKPELTNRQAVQRLLQTLYTNDPALRNGSNFRRQTRLRMLLSRAGEVVHIEVDRSSGDARADSLAAGVVAQMRFRPASISGVPWDTWIILPITLMPPTRENTAPGGILNQTRTGQNY